MDPSEPGDRCLPEMGLSGWMKRTMERSYDLSDFCNSPPVDGFFYPNLQQQKGNNTGVAGKGNCSADPNTRKEETRSCTVMGGVMSINQAQPLSQQLSQAMGPNASMYHHAAGMNTINGGGCTAMTGHETPSSVPGYLQPVVTGFSSSAFSKQLSLGLAPNQSVTESPTSSEDGKDQSPAEMRSWGNAGDGNDMYRRIEHLDLAHHADLPSDDSAPTPVDHIVSSRFTPTIQINSQEDQGGPLRLVEKLGGAGSSCPATPDVTPCSTPAVTPSHSPQVSRRHGNPFFTGTADADDSNSGSGSTSWLFRPGKKTDNNGSTLHPDKLYEAKIEYQQQPNSRIQKKTVRYVPRPSELRELNFWSPTSM